MHTVTWIPRCTRLLHSISTPSPDIALSLADSLRAAGDIVRVWHSVKKGQPMLVTE